MHEIDSFVKRVDKTYYDYYGCTNYLGSTTYVPRPYLIGIRESAPLLKSWADSTYPTVQMAPTYIK